MRSVISVSPARAFKLSVESIPDEITSREDLMCRPKKTLHPLAMFSFHFISHLEVVPFSLLKQ